MSRLLRAHAARRRPSAPLLIALAGAALLGACAQASNVPGEPSLLARPDAGADRSGLAHLNASSAKATPAEEGARAQPAGPATSPALAQARSLRQAGDKTKALAVLDRSAQKDAKLAKDASHLRERGMLALELGQVEKARTLLKTAVDQGNADWRSHSALGAALSALGRQQEAQLQFARALEQAPDQPSVLNNLALSYALDGKHDQAEGLLRRVALTGNADARTKQNLALILGLKGRQEEASRVSAAVLPADKARANARMLQEKGDGEGTAKPPAPARAPVASAGESASVQAAAAQGADPTYRLGGPRQ